jgi:hypothetical protein
MNFTSNMWKNYKLDRDLDQGDQMSLCKKIAQNVAQPILLKLLHSMCIGKM